MSSVRALIARLPLAWCCLMAVTSCTHQQAHPPATTGVPESTPMHPTSAANTTGAHDSTHASTHEACANAQAKPTRPAVDIHAAPVVDRLAAQLMIAPDTIIVSSVAPATWPDACLGLAAEGEICASVMTPGYAVMLKVGQDVYEFRTDATAEQIRVASAPAAKTGDPLVTWRDSRSFTILIVGTQRVAIGRRGRPLIACPLAVPARATELQAYLARFAPFQAQTPAGEIALRGIGSSRASETDQRMISEWARLVSLEARLGSEQPGAALAARWTRSGGIAGVCDAIEVSRTGETVATSCRQGASVPISRLQLSSEDLAMLFSWLDRLEAFSDSRQEPGAVPDAFTTTLDFAGGGIDEANAGDRQKMFAWFDGLAVRLRDAALH